MNLSFPLHVLQGALESSIGFKTSRNNIGVVFGNEEKVMATPNTRANISHPVLENDSDDSILPLQQAFTVQRQRISALQGEPFRTPSIDTIHEDSLHQDLFGLVLESGVAVDRAIKICLLRTGVSSSEDCPRSSLYLNYVSSIGGYYG